MKTLNQKLEFKLSQSVAGFGAIFIYKIENLLDNKKPLTVSR